MKKLTSLLTLGLAVGALGGSSFFLSRANQEKKVEKPVFADAEEDTYIPFTLGEGGNFEIHTTDGTPGQIDNADATFWGGHFFALDSFFRGEKEINWHGTITSKTFIQKTRYIYFTWGGRAEMSINFKKADDSLIGSMTNDLSNGNPMILNYYKIPDSVTDEQLAVGVEMYLELVDDYDDGGYGFSNFGYLHPNATEKDISDAMWAQIDILGHDVEEERFRGHWVLQHFTYNAKFDGIRELSARTNVNEDFEDNATFLSRWFRDPNYNIGDFGKSHDDTIISTISNRIGDTNLPINKTGTGFFKGYHEDGTGYFAGDDARYRFVSKPFLLSGTGFISIKMAGGSASLHVLRGVSRNDTDENEIEYDLAWINKKNFVQADEGNVAVSGQNTVTLTRHVINLSAFLGEIIQIAIADVDTNSAWSATNFDELITYYPTAPSFKVDFAVQKETIHPYYLDKYVAADHASAADGLEYRQVPTEYQEHSKLATVDNSASKAAYSFLSNFYSTLRAKGQGSTYCNIQDLDTSALETAYGELSADAKKIVNASDDFDYTRAATSENWYTFTPVRGTVGATLAALGFSGASARSNSLFRTMNNNTMAFIIVAGSIVALIGLAFLLFKRRKANRA